MNDLTRVARRVAAVLLLASSVAHPASITYEYDHLGRLIAVVYGDGTRTDYTLDPAGNRKTVTTQLPPGPGVLQWSSPKIGRAHV